MLGVFVLYLVLQLAAATIGGVVLGVIGAAVSGPPDASLDGAFFDNGIQVVMVATQLLAVAVFWPWWRRARRGSFGERREVAVEATRGAHGAAATAKAVLALLLVGVAAQYVVGVALGVVGMFFPDAMADYAELMEESATGVFALVAMASTAVLAPINEEIVCRGVMLEYAMRAVSPCWNARDRASRCSVSPRAFWTANVLQALAFGVLHLNLIQGSYAFALGVLEGWVFWRTGKLRYPMLLHFALNASSYLVEPLAPVVDALPAAVVLIGFGALLAAGVSMFGRVWRAPDSLPAVGDGDARAV